MSPLLLLLLFLGACGDGDGNDDTLWTGLSGIIIFVIVAWVIVHYLRKRTK